MNWIKKRWRSWWTTSKPHKGDNQLKLVLLVCIPCFFVSAFSLFLADVSGYFIAFILIILFLVCSYVVVASKQNSDYQIRTLSNLIESMIDGDYTLRGRLQTNKAFQELLELINNLANVLSTHKIEAKQSRLLLERMMEQMDAMVLVVDENGFVAMANASATKLLLNDEQAYERVMLSNLPIGQEIMEAKSGIITFEHGQLSGEHLLSKETFLSEGKHHQLFMLTNAERLLMEKERSAWQSLLRVLSHEMNNSLTPIIAISDSMSKKLANSEAEVNKAALVEGAKIIHERANSLSAFIASYSQLSHLPKPVFTNIQLSELLGNLSVLFPQCQVHRHFADDVLVHVDKGQFEQVLINLLKNAEEAMHNTDTKSIDITCEFDHQWQYITISDHGTGIANLDNIFVPFYSTKREGSGIGLALCRQIMFNHHGTIKLMNREGEQGVEVTLSLPNTLH